MGMKKNKKIALNININQGLREKREDFAESGT